MVYVQADDGAWGAHSPDVEGVFALGASREEVERRMLKRSPPTSSTSVTADSRSLSPTRTPGGSLPNSHRCHERHRVRLDSALPLVR